MRSNLWRIWHDPYRYACRFARCHCRIGHQKEWITLRFSQKIKSIILIALFSILSGCASKNASPLDARIQQTFAELPSFTAQVKIISCAGQSPLEYGGLYEYQKDSADTFTLKSPEALSGIAIHIAGEKADEISVQYAETVLEPGLPAQPGMTPADAIPTLLDLLRNAAPQETWEETIGGAKMAAVRYETEDGSLTYQIWLTQESLKLSYAECYADGERVLQIAFSEYQT